MTVRPDVTRKAALQTPDALRPIIEMISALLGQRDTHNVLERDDISEGAESLISILGRRGSGKTTLLAAVCAELEASHDAIVLPTIRPEIFDATDSLLLAVLIEVEGFLDGTAPSAVNTQHGLGLALGAAIRSVGVSSSGAYAALQESRESAGQYGVDAAAMVRHRRNQAPQLSNVFRELRGLLARPSTTPVIIPIDDADLSPANLNSVLYAVRTLGAISNVVPVICADREQLEVAVAASLFREYSGKVDDDKVRELAIQVVAKLLRPERCFSPPTLTVASRAAFRPIGQSLSISELLSSVRINRESSLNRLIWETSTITEPLEPVGVNEWLPQTPRELVYLAESIQALGDLPRGAEPAIVAQRLQRLIQHILSYSREYSVIAEPESRKRAVNTSNEPSMRVVWPSLSYGLAAQGRFIPAVGNSELRFRVRRWARMRAALFPEATTVSQGDSVDLSAQATSSAQAIQELQISGSLGEPRQSTPSYVGETEFEFLQSVVIFGQSTDDSFVIFPDSCGVAAITRAAVSWNRLVEDARDANRSRSEVAAGSLARRYFHLVHRYWLRGDQRALQIKRLPSFERTLEALGHEYLALVEDDDGSHLDNYSQERAFCNWFEVSAPRMFHSNILGDDRASRAVAVWLDAISAGPRAVEATENLRSSMESRFATRFGEERRKKTGDHAWIFGYEPLSRHIGTELHADVLTLKEAYLEKRRSRVVGHDILGDNIALSVVKGPYKYLAHRTVEGDEDLGVLREVLEQYRSR